MTAEQPPIETVRSERESSAIPPSVPPGVAPTGVRLRARLVDAAGRVKPNSSYLLTPLDPNYCARERERWIERVSDSKGEIDERELTPGWWRLMFAPTYCEPQSMRVELREGLHDLGELVFPVIDEAGSVCVRAPEREPPLSGVLWLRSIDSLAVDRWSYLGRSKRSRLDPQGSSSFCFEHLPAGDYEVRLFADDPLGVRVDTQRVSVPGAEIVFERAATTQLELRIQLRTPAPSSAERRSAVLSFSRRTRRFQSHRTDEGRATVKLERGDERRWFAVASDCRPREFEVGTHDAREGWIELDIELSAGWGALLVTRDGDALLRTPGIGHESQLRRERAELLAGAKIHDNGQVLLRTDADGLGLLIADLAPQRLEATSLARCQIDVVNWRDGALLDPLAPIEFWLGWIDS